MTATMFRHKSVYVCANYLVLLRKILNNAFKISNAFQQLHCQYLGMSENRNSCLILSCQKSLVIVLNRKNYAYDIKSEVLRQPIGGLRNGPPI